MRLAVVGGSALLNLDDLDAFTSIGLKLVSKDDKIAETPYGKVALTIIVLEAAPCYPVAGRGLQHTIVFLQRNQADAGASWPPPHAIEHRANIRALADLNVDAIVATTSVGTIVPSFPPGRVGLARQYIDFSGVPVTFNESSAKFTSVTQPFDEALNEQLEGTLRRMQGLGGGVRLGFTCWLSTGPQYETEAEVNAIDRLGGEVCGFTMPREAKLCAELGIPYAALLVATNWAAGRHPGDHAKALSHEEVTACAAQRLDVIRGCLVDVLKDAIRGGAGSSKRKRADA